MTLIKRYKQESLLPKFQLIRILHFQDMHEYLCFIVPIDYCVEWSFVQETFYEKLLSFHTEMILA